MTILLLGDKTITDKWTVAAIDSLMKTWSYFRDNKIQQIFDGNSIISCIMVMSSQSQEMKYSTTGGDYSRKFSSYNWEPVAGAGP